MKVFTCITARLLVVFVAFSLSCSKDSKSPTEPSSEIHEIHGITFASIPGGTFQMGSNDGDSDEKPIHNVTLDGFEMSTTEVTNAQYCAYLNEVLATGDITATRSIVTGATGEYKEKMYIFLYGKYYGYPSYNNECWISYNNSTLSVRSGKENWPVVYVTWYGAKAFALYYGLDLPTEAELEYAARGGKQYKYGTDDGTISTSKANYWDTGIKYPVDVGSYPANPFSLYDMSGNVWERCNDWWGDYSSDSVTNPTGPQTGSFRVIRGGGWFDITFGCRSAARVGLHPLFGSSSIGFRVVRRPGGKTY